MWVQTVMSAILPCWATLAPFCGDISGHPTLGIIDSGFWSLDFVGHVGLILVGVSGQTPFACMEPQFLGNVSGSVAFWGYVHFGGTSASRNIEPQFWANASGSSAFCGRVGAFWVGRVSRGLVELGFLGDPPINRRYLNIERRTVWFRHLLPLRGWLVAVWL